MNHLARLICNKLGIPYRRWILTRSKIKFFVGKMLCSVLKHKKDFGISFKTRSVIEFCPRCFGKATVKVHAAKA